MSSVPRLPMRGSDVTIFITRVHLHPLCALVEFWGKFSQERITDYESLAKDIQSPGATFKDLEGDPGNQCLAQIDGTWYRSRIVSRDSLNYSVFLIDKGITYTTNTSSLAWGKKEHFQLPPEVEFCVLANVAPLSPENRWSPVALEFLRSLSGKSMKAHVQDVLVSHRTFLLQIPCISKQMYEMGFAKKLSDVAFQEFVVKSLKPHSGAETFPEIQQVIVGSGDRLQKQDLFMYPELPGGTVETVLVTEVTNPLRIFCQLKVFSQELKKLSVQITQNYEDRVSSFIVSHDMIGFPCAARGSDGKWYRSVLQQVFPTNKLVEVLNVDYGTKQVVQVENVRPLTAEFFRMPVVTYMCSLHGVIDKGVGWTSNQIDFLRSLLLSKTVIAKFEYQSISEGVYYVTLYSDGNTNLNTLFGSKEKCLLQCEKALGDFAIQSTTDRHHFLSQQEEKMLPFQQTAKQNDAKTGDKPPLESLALNSSNLATVEHISNPSAFWIQTKNHKTEFDELFESMHHLYQDSTNKNVVKNPTLGLYCAAQAEDGEFYRATVAELSETQVTVFFVDYGNTEMIDKSNIRTLPPEFKKMPQLALKCTLANVRPKGCNWSQSALEFFIQAVTNKVLNLHVKAKYSDCFVVQLKDLKAHGEQDVGTQMCSLGLAERTEILRQPAVKSAIKTAVTYPTSPSDAQLLGHYKNSGNPFQCPPSLIQESFATFKEYTFPVGSVLDVSVSYIESPNDFWCQLVQNAGCLKLLMHDLQAHYAGSEYEPNVEMACVARHPDNKMWYRALVIRKHETPFMDVLFVDYGQTKTVSVFDLRKISSEYLALQGQAFRCSLLNPITPTSAINEWNEDAKLRFKTFVETAASKFIILKCTIYAIMYSEQMILYNIVDLGTPFESICTSMANLITGVPPKKAIGPSFRLDTYYYSTHNVKTGAEEQVTVTYVHDVSQFYCHLKKNADVTQDLQIKVNSLCKHIEKVKFPPVFGTLCFARYSDGQWYRAQIKTTRPEILVHFVDYGDTIEVDKSDLLPIPKEATDIMSVPVQAILCGLSDIPANVPSEVNKWFETTAAECPFRALIVAREPDGKLLVELYHGNTQINAKIKREFQIEVQPEKGVVYRGFKAWEPAANYTQKTAKAYPNQSTDIEDHKHVKNNNFSAPKSPSQMQTKEKPTDVNPKTAQKPTRHLCENRQKIRPAPIELYKPPHQRQSDAALSNKSQQAADKVKPKEENMTFNTKCIETPETKSQRENHSEQLPKLSDLPSNNITPGVAVDVYVSHCNSPLSFYVQCVSKENEIFSLVEKLNDSDSAIKDSVTDVHPGDLIQAEFAEDSSWYRAVVKEIHEDGSALVEFVDFGNTALTPTFKLSRLHTSLLQFPVYSTHCMLIDAAVFGEEKVLNPEVVSAFKEDLSCCGEKVLKCQFFRQVGSMWEVSLEDSGVDIVCKMSSGVSEITKTQVTEQPTQISDLRQETESPETSSVNPCSLRYPQQQNLSEGQQLEAYITIIHDGLAFYSQSADSEELNKITLSVSEVGNTADKCMNLDDLIPGSPCITLFSDDQLWYRAEVIDKIEEELSVLFVDYGNQSQANKTDVREMPPFLVEIPPQAFLCELEGFDTSCGSWMSGAEDTLSTLTLDKPLKLTVTRVSRSGEKTKCFVHMDCEGQVINEVMKSWWLPCTEADISDSDRQLPLSESPSQLDSTASVPEDQLKHPDIQDVFKSATCIHPESENNKDQSAEKLTCTSLADNVLNLAESPKHNMCSDSSIQLELFVQSTEEEQDSTEGGNIVPDITNIPQDILTCSGDAEETTSPSVDNEEDQDALSMSCKVTVATYEGSDEESASVVHACEEDVFDSPLKENILSESMEELNTETSDMENTSADSLDNEPPSALSNASCNREVAVSRGNSLTTVKMVLRNVAPQETRNTSLNLSKEAKLVPSSLPVPVQVCGTSTEQESEAGDGTTQQEEGQRDISTHVKDDSACEEEPQSALLEATDTAISEEQSNTVSSPDTAADLDELTCCVELACSADSEEPCVHEAVTVAADCRSSVTAEERSFTSVQKESIETAEGSGADMGDVVQQFEVSFTSVPDEDDLTTGDESTPPQDDQLSDLSEDTESQIDQDLKDMMEELTSRIEEIHLSGISRDSGEAQTSEPGDEQPPTSPQNKDLDESLLPEHTSSAEDSFEAQLSTVIHLTLVIKDASDVLLAEQQPEE